MHDSCFTSDGKYGCVVINCCIASRPIKPLEIVCMQMHFGQNKGCLTDRWFILMFGCYFRVGKTKKELLWNITLSVYIHMRHEASVNLTQLWHFTEQNSYVFDTHQAAIDLWQVKTSTSVSRFLIQYIWQIFPFTGGSDFTSSFSFSLADEKTNHGKT